MIVSRLTVRLLGRKRDLSEAARKDRNCNCLSNLQAERVVRSLKLGLRTK